MTNIQIVVYDGFDELDAIGPYEVFDTAARFGADIDVQLVTLDPVDVVEAGHGLNVEPQGTLSVPDDPDASDDLDSPDVLVVPGGGWNDRAGAGAWKEVERGDLPEAIASLHANGTTLASVCTGGMILAHAGVLDGKPATTHAGALDDLQELVGEVRDERFVDSEAVVTGDERFVDSEAVVTGDERFVDSEAVVTGDERFVDCGSILTSGGVTSGFDLSLHLVERIADEQTAEQVARNIEYERQSAYQS
jgi:transcriptional regulator GlxA family with amidase domain